MTTVESRKMILAGFLVALFFGVPILGIVTPLTDTHQQETQDELIDSSQVKFSGSSGSTPVWNSSIVDSVSGENLAITPDGDYAVMGTYGNWNQTTTQFEGGTVSLYHYSSQIPLWTFQVGDSATGVDISDSGDYIVGATNNGSLHVWNASSSVPIWTYNNNNNSLFSPSISSDGGSISVSDWITEEIIFFENFSSTPKWRLAPTTTAGSIPKSMVSSSGDYIVAYHDYYLNLYRNNSTSVVWSFPYANSSGNQPEYFEISDDESTMVIGTYNGTSWSGPGDTTVYSGKTYLYNVTNQNLIWSHTHAHNNLWAAYGISDDGQLISHCSHSDGNITLFSHSSSIPLWQYQTNDQCKDSSVSSDGGRIIAGYGGSPSNYGTVALWDSSNGTPIWTYGYPASQYAHAVEISDDGQRMYVGTSSGASFFSTPSSSSNSTITPSNVDYITISSGYRDTCGILVNGSVVCWGSGTGVSYSGSGGLIQMPPNSYATSVSVGLYHACMILHDGSVYCWGHDTDGELGNGLPLWGSGTPLQVSMPVGEIAVEISLGRSTSCAVTANGSAYCWGDNGFGQVGTNNRSDVLSPHLVSLGGQVSSVNVGFRHTCALLHNGSVYCWGENANGQLGDGTTTGTCPLVNGSGWNCLSPVQALLPRSAVSITTGNDVSCAILDNYSAMCWGRNSTGQLGDGSVPCSGTGVDSCANSVPIYVQKPSNNTHFVQIDTADIMEGHTCALVQNGSVYCWGANDFGQLGDGSTTERHSPVAVIFSSQSQISAITTGARHTCAVLQNNSAMCWGDNYVGQLGNLANGGNESWFDQGIDSNTPSYVTCMEFDTSSNTCNGLVLSNDFSNGTIPICTPGYYINATNIANCNVASPGNFVNGSGATSQTACSPGTYQPYSGQSSCIDASPGHYVTGNGSTNQTACSSGTYNLNSGSSSSTDCISTSPGYYSSNNGSSNQTAASPGNFVNGSGATSQTACSSGTYQPYSGQSSCIDASPGHFVSGVGSTNQTACSPGTYNPNSGSSSSTDCIYSSPGYYSPNNGSSNQTACPPGTYQPSPGQYSCIYSSSGHFVNASGSTYQQSCTPGSYQPYSGQQTCYSASGGHYATGYGSTNQTACNPGTYNPYNGSASPSDCVDAEPGYRVNYAGWAHQEQCWTGRYQPSSGQSSCIDASPGHFVSRFGSTSQTACTPGTYQPYSGQLSCWGASPGHFVSGFSSTNQTACSPGTHQPYSGQSSCIDASPGNYVNFNGSTFQIPCEKGSFNPIYGATNISYCLPSYPGYYVEENGSSTQKPCPEGTFSPSLGIDDVSGCIDSLPGYYVPTAGSDSQLPCIIGTYNPNFGSITCLISPPGYHAEESGMANAIPCPIGSYQPSEGQSRCLDSPPGSFVPISGSNSTLLCALGSYQPLGGQGNCLDSTPGFYVDEEGSDTQTPCPKGTYNPNYNSVDLEYCTPASPGYYVDSEGSETQLVTPRDFYTDLDGMVGPLACPDLHITKFDGATSSDDCLLDSDSDRISDTEDADDDDDGILDQNDFCSPGLTDWMSGFVTDNDGDGCNDDSEDEDDDNDGRADSLDAFPLDSREQDDTDGDGLGNNYDLDDDNDGVSDALEYDMGTEPLNHDTDGDGFSDKSDIFPLLSTEWEDSDGDGTGDNSDILVNVQRYQDMGDIILDIFALAILLPLATITLRGLWKVSDPSTHKTKQRNEEE